MNIYAKLVIATIMFFLSSMSIADDGEPAQEDDIIVVNPDDQTPQSATQQHSSEVTNSSSADTSSSSTTQSMPQNNTQTSDSNESMISAPSSDPNPATHSSRGSEMAVKVLMYEATPAGQGKLLGDIRIMQTDYGLVFEPDLKDIRAGLHGFHVHEMPSCKPMVHNGAPAAAIGAGEHYDPEKNVHHMGPWKNGHLGDLPVLFADDKGRIETPVLAPRLKMSDIHLRSLVIHEEGDNYSDQPQHLGGGGARIACGVIR